VVTDTFSLIAQQRRAVANLLDELTTEQWSAPTLCDGWRVQEMAAHLTMPFRMGNPRFFARVIANRGSIARTMDQFARRHADEPRDVLIAYLRDHATSRFVPPTFPDEASLAEITVHGFDIAVPCGRHVEVPEEITRRVLDYLVSPKAGSVHTTRGVARGVRLVSTDSTWSWGEGPTVTGTNFGLLMLLARRPVAFDHVSGDGVEVVRAHLARV